MVGGERGGAGVVDAGDVECRWFADLYHEGWESDIEWHSQSLCGYVMDVHMLGIDQVDPAGVHSRV